MVFFHMWCSLYLSVYSIEGEIQAALFTALGDTSSAQASLSFFTIGVFWGTLDKPLLLRGENRKCGRDCGVVGGEM